MTTSERDPAIPPTEDPTSVDGITPMDDLPGRIKTAGERCEELVLQTKLAREARDQLMVVGVNSGITQRLVAKLAGLSQPHLTRILAAS